MSNLALDTKAKFELEKRGEIAGKLPSLARSSIVTSHMAPPTIQAGMIDLSSPNRFLLPSPISWSFTASCSGFIVHRYRPRSRSGHSVGVSDVDGRQIAGYFLLRWVVCRQCGRSKRKDREKRGSRRKKSRCPLRTIKFERLGRRRQ